MEVLNDNDAGARFSSPAPFDTRRGSSDHISNKIHDVGNPGHKIHIMKNALLPFVLLVVLSECLASTADRLRARGTRTLGCDDQERKGSDGGGKKPKGKNVSFPALVIECTMYY